MRRLDKAGWIAAICVALLCIPVACAKHPTRSDEYVVTVREGDVVTEYTCGKVEIGHGVVTLTALQSDDGLEEVNIMGAVVEIRHNVDE